MKEVRVNVRISAFTGDTNARAVEQLQAGIEKYFGGSVKFAGRVKRTRNGTYNFGTVTLLLPEESDHESAPPPELPDDFLIGTSDPQNFAYLDRRQ